MDPASTFGGLFAKPTPRRLLVASPFVAVAVVLVALAIFFMDLLSAARAYVGGESLWTMAQKQAVQSLERFAQLRDGAEWLAYQRAIAVPLGDRVAREELEKPAPDFEVARRGFIAGGIDPDDIDGMMRLFRWFRSDRLIDEAIRHLGRGRRPDHATDGRRRGTASRGRVGGAADRADAAAAAHRRPRQAPDAAGNALLGHPRRGDAQHAGAVEHRDGLGGAGADRARHADRARVAQRGSRSRGAVASQRGALSFAVGNHQ